MDRKGLIAVALAIIGLFWWTQDFSSKSQKALQQRQAEEAAQKKAAAARATPVPGTAAAPGTPAGPAVPFTPTPAAVPEQVEKIATPGVEYAFTNLGGGIAQAMLRQHDAEHGPVTLNEFGHTPIGALSETAGQDVTLPWTGTRSPAGISYTRTDARQLQIVKEYTLPASGGADAYSSHLEVKFTNLGAQPLEVPNYYVYTGSAGPIHQRDVAVNTGFGWSREGRFTFKNASSFTSGGFLWMGRSDSPVFTEQLAGIGWAGVSSQYFTTVLTPEPKGLGVLARHFTIPRDLVGSGRGSAEPGAPADPAAPTMDAVEGALLLPGFALAPGASSTAKFDLYTGPREYRRLLALGSGQDAILDFGMFRAICKVLLAAMNWLHAHLWNNYGAAIAVLTLCIRGLMWPLQNKGTQSMKRMQALTPQMNALKEKYADDPGKMNAEVLKLYKTHGVNPVSGCLPQLLLIPIFFAFYAMLGKAVELRNARLWWVKDLSAPDTVAHFFGQPLNVLPLLMVTTMVGRTWLSPKPNDPMQQKLTMFMPVIFFTFCYNYASALALYITVQNLFDMAQLWITRDQKTPALQKVALPAKKKR